MGSGEVELKAGGPGDCEMTVRVRSERGEGCREGEKKARPVAGLRGGRRVGGNRGVLPAARGRKVGCVQGRRRRM
jgi:hypothetical protein